MLLITLKLIHVAVCIFLILVVLFQQGKGADLSVFGGGSTMNAFGARGAANVFHKLTVTGFVLFTVTTLSISLVQSHMVATTVMDDMPVASETADEAPSDAAVATESETAPAEAAEASDSESAPAASEDVGESAGGEENGEG